MTDADAATRPSNRLAGETSPYLLQHAHNPVDWYPWGEEALARARREDRLVLLSIGYSACHWCHVMERESFEDASIAALMNERFVNVKVDREERPDLDEIYMAATVAMNQGQGGWPMTVFLTPRLEPVFAGTYYPPEDRYGRPGFPRLLRTIADAWRDDPERLRRGAGELAAHLRRASAAAAPPAAIGEETLRRAMEQLAADYDAVDGGFGGAPKFPPATTIRLLLRLHATLGDERALAMARGTLDAMARGGIHDQVGGGFHRYAVDRRWLVPHFEKMLYDNALLAVAYLEGFQATGDVAYRDVAAATLDYLLREMTSPEGAFHSSTDADSEGEEGKFFVWAPEELAAALPPEEARAVAAFHDVTAEGNWEGKSILHAPRPMADVARELGVDEAELHRRLAAARPKLHAARARRVPPGLDDKVLAAWNGLAIAACAEGHRTTGDARYLDAATRAADFVLAELVDGEGRLLRAWRAGRAQHRGVLEDHAYLAAGLLALYETGGERRFLDRAVGLAERILAEFADPEGGGFFHTAAGGGDLLYRYREGTDGATPSPNAVAAGVLARLAVHTDRDDLRRAAAVALEAWGELARRVPRAFAASLLVADFLAAGPVELAWVGRRGEDALAALRAAAATVFVPRRVEAVADPDDAAATAGLPLLAGKGLVEGRAALYVCRDYACGAPVTDPAEVAGALAAGLSNGPSPG